MRIYLRPVQTKAHVAFNIVQHCCAQHVASFKHPVARHWMMLPEVWTKSNFMQHRPTSCNRVSKRCNMLRATMLDDVACNMLPSFERAFTHPRAWWSNVSLPFCCCLFVCPSDCWLSINLFCVCLFIYLFVCLSTCLFVYFVFLFVHLFVCLSFCRFVFCLFVCLYFCSGVIHLLFAQFVHFFVCLSVDNFRDCLSLCLFVRWLVYFVFFVCIFVAGWFIFYLFSLFISLFVCLSIIFVIVCLSVNLFVVWTILCFRLFVHFLVSLSACVPSHFVIASHFVIPVALCNNTCCTL